MKKDLIKMIFTALLYAFFVPEAVEAQQEWDADNEICYNDQAASYPVYSRNYDYPIDTYTSVDYDSNSRYSYNNYRDGSYQGSNGNIHFGRKFDNSDNFTSGISSYQGTSTGPGPNGGYPGAPRGIYETNYITHPTYNNSYRQVHLR